MTYRKVHNNKGSAIIVVLIAVAFLTILGSLLLFTTSTGYLMKITERRGKQNFYSAETAMNEIRLGVQQVASDAITKAYTHVLVEYNTAADTEDIFKNYFKQALYDWRSSDGGRLLIPGGTLGTDSYDPSVLKDFLSAPDGVVLRADGPALAANDRISLRKLSLTYTKDGYSTTISTDIRINMPEFSYTLSELILSAVPDFTLVARGTLRQEQGGSMPGIIVDGNAYAGSILVSGQNNTMNVGVADNFICRGNLTVENGAKFVNKSSSALWCRTVDLNGPKSVIELAGDTYFADDLTLNGSESAAVLSGRCFGFGNSETDPNHSSSIIINGHDTTLDLTGLRNLMLAGNSFIGAPVQGGDVLMGESLSVKSNQLAYLIPSGCIGTSNPSLYPITSVPDADTLKACVNRNYELWNGRTLGSYISDVQLVFYPIPAANQMLVYYYMKFDTAALADAYFSDYFTFRKEEIEQYLGVYSQRIAVSRTAPRSVSGSLTAYENGLASLLDASLLVSDSTCARLNTMFANFCATLSPNIGGDPNHPDASVYEYIVNEEEVNKLNQYTYFKNNAGQVVGIIIKNNGNTNLSSLDPNVKVVISTGSITIDRTGFKGLVIAGGDINLQQNCEADHLGVSEAFQATCDLPDVNSEPLSMLDFLQISTQSTGAATGTASVNWDMEQLVTYGNWTKN